MRVRVLCAGLICATVQDDPTNFGNARLVVAPVHKLTITTVLNDNSNVLSLPIRHVPFTAKPEPVFQSRLTQS